MDNILSKMSPFSKRTILYMDSLGDETGVATSIRSLGLKVRVVRSVSEVADKAKCPHIDTIVADALVVVSIYSFFYLLGISMLFFQTENLREHEHLRYIPVVLLAPYMPRLNCEYPFIQNDDAF